MTEQADATRAEHEAAQWFARLSRTAVTTEELKAFRAWKQQPGHARAYERLEQTWAAAETLKTDPDIQSLTAAALARRPAHKPRARRIAAAGALLLASTAAGLAALSLWLNSGDTYRTRTGEQRLLVLADGSRVRLNTDSELHVRLTGRDRRLTLAKGEAFFEAAHDPSRPFLVTAGPAQVRAIGTRFDVRKEAQATQVTLLQGQVEVRRTTAAAAQVLTPNETLTVTGQGLSAPHPTDAQADTGWTTGRLTFRNLPLRAAIAEVNRYSDRKIVLDGPASLQQAPVSGVFDTGDTKAFVAAASALFDLKASQTGTGDTHLSPAAS